MGLRVDIYRSRYDSTYNAFHGVETVVVTNVEGPFEPDDETPEAILSKNALDEPILIPVGKPVGSIGPMMGGTYAGSSDSRWARATGVRGAIPVHDRFETPEQYRALSA